LKTAAGIVVSPLTGFVLALLLVLIVSWLFVRFSPFAVDSTFRILQFVSASLYSLGHGGNDAQKTMGIITLTLITVGLLPAGAAPPLWVVTAAGLAIAAGTAMGGWRIIRTLGRRISEIEPAQGFAAETASTAIILSASHLGFALSTTQVASGAVLGSAAGRRAAPVHWGVAGRMAGVWLLTLPAAAVIGAAAAWIAARGTTGTVVVVGLLVAAAGAIYAASRRMPVTAATVNDAPAPRPVVLAAPAAA
jgi:PiT family inorganic phosphate transporter